MSVDYIIRVIFCVLFIEHLKDFKYVKGYIVEVKVNIVEK